MITIPETCSPVNARSLLGTVLDEAEASLRAVIGLRVSKILSATVSHILGRLHHQRRGEVPRETHREGQCCRCQSRASYRFSRNGFRERQLSSLWGELQIDLPRVRCQCGGSVLIDFGGLLRPYQRVWDEVDAQIQRWGALAMSLRQMRQELAHLHIAPLALRALNQRLQALSSLDIDRDAKDVPDVVQLDAIWVTQLRPNGKVHRDRKGRMRPVKGRYKRPILIAMGVWPDTGRCEILLWQMGESENAEAWIAFLTLLEEQGIRGKNGLKVIIHDGGQGLCSALDIVYFGAVTQRCLFHKLRNIYNAIHLPEDLSPQQRRRRRRAILQGFRAIWDARHYQTTLRRYLQVVRTWRHTQPEAVAALRNDFRTTITYYHLQQQYPAWSRTDLRTTSCLERFNRRIRRRARAANAYHSDQSILAMVAQEAQQFHLAQHQP